MLPRSRSVVAVAFALSTLVLGACKKREMPSDFVGSYARSGDTPANLRAELSVARGGMVLTVVRLSASMDMGVFSTLFKGAGAASGVASGTAGAQAGLARTVVSARTFQSLACDGTSCRFELAADKDQEACSGSFDKVQNTVIVVAAGACLPYSGRWVMLDGLPPEAKAPVGEARDASGPTTTPSTPPSAPSPAPSGSVAKLEFPTDIPAPHDHMSCLEACSIVDTRCHRTSAIGDRDAFLGCVEKGQICRARCEQVFPFFGERGTKP